MLVVLIYISLTYNNNLNRNEFLFWPNWSKLKKHSDFGLVVTENSYACFLALFFTAAFIYIFYVVYFIDLIFIYAICAGDGPVLLSVGHRLASKQVLALAAIKSMGWCVIYGCFINLNLDLTKSTQTYAVEHRFSLLIAILRFQLMIKIEHFYGLCLVCYIGNFTLMYKNTKDPVSRTYGNQ